MRTTTPLRLSALALAGLLAGGCTAAADPLDSPPVATTQVRVIDDLFEPVAAEVPAGTEVTWTWEGDNLHNVTADDFSSDVQDQGIFRHTFDQAGTYRYRCTLHAGMEGAVVVADQP